MKLADFLMLIGFKKKDKRSRLLAGIKKAGYPGKEVFVSVEDFFDGNTDDGSIGANIYPNPPSLQKFRDILTDIKNADKTNTLLIRIADTEDNDWFYTDMVFINGDYTLSAIKKLFKVLKPSEVYEGLMYNEKPNNIPHQSSGKNYSIWWD
ncbi:hypothetical protein ACFGVR_14285 [Mucilaginibacter sp. AW1-3]